MLNSKVVKLEGELRLESIGIEYIEGTNDLKKLIEEDINGLNKKESGLQAAEIQDIQTKVRSIEVAGLFIAIGQVPSNEIFKNVIDLDEYGYIVATENCKTNIDGIFVAGDCRTKKVRQLTTAASDGAIAGLAACEYIG